MDLQTDGDGELSSSLAFIVQQAEAILPYIICHFLKLFVIIFTVMALGLIVSNDK